MRTEGMVETLDQSPPESIGARLRRLRSERGFSQRELSAPGVSYAYISRIEAGTRQPSVKALRKLARKLGVSPEYLETGAEVGDSERREIVLADAEIELRLAGPGGEAEARLAEVLADAVEAGDGPAATRARIALGGAAAAAGRIDEAASLLEDAAADESVTPVARPDVFAQLGQLYLARGEARRATELFERSLVDLTSEAPEHTGARVRYATGLSHALTEAGEVERAQESLDEVLASQEDVADPYRRVELHWSLARHSAAAGRQAAALGHARRATALLDALEDTAQLGRAHLLCGSILLRRGNAEAAQGQLARAERLFESHPGSRDLALLRIEQARRAVFLEDGADAIARSREALELLGDGDRDGERGAASLALAEGLALQGETDAAADAFGKAVDSFEGAGLVHDAAQAYRSWGRILREAGREREALDALDRAAELGVSAGRPDDLVRR
jgi:tetratricopeptide (TPR) repeat protein